MKLSMGVCSDHDRAKPTNPSEPSSARISPATTLMAKPIASSHSEMVVSVMMAPELRQLPMVRRSNACTSFTSPHASSRATRATSSLGRLA